MSENGWIAALVVGGLAAGIAIEYIGHKKREAVSKAGALVNDYLASAAEAPEVQEISKNISEMTANFEAGWEEAKVKIAAAMEEAEKKRIERQVDREIIGMEM